MSALVIDTTLAAVQVAVGDADGIRVRRTVPMLQGHAEALLPMVEAVLAEAGFGYAAIERVIVTIGPGTFAGIRIGLAAARALGLALAKSVVGVGTLDAFAATAPRTGRSIVAAIDARRGDVYLRAYGAGGHPLGPALAVALADLASHLPTGPCVAVGPGAALVANVRPDVIVHPGDALPPIEVVLALGLAAPLPDRPPAPLYLRPPDAKPQPLPMPRRP